MIKRNEHCSRGPAPSGKANVLDVILLSMCQLMAVTCGCPPVNVCECVCGRACMPLSGTCMRKCVARGGGGMRPSACMLMRMHLCVGVCMRAHAHPCVLVWVCVCVCVYVCVCVCVCCWGGCACLWLDLFTHVGGHPGIRLNLHVQSVLFMSLLIHYPRQGLLRLGRAPV